MRIKNIFLAFIFVYFRLIYCAKGLDPLDDICVGKHNVLVAHPDLCTHFFLCYLETPVIFFCEYPTEVFHNGECVAGNPNTCEIFTTTTVTPRTTSRTPSTTSKTTTTNEQETSTEPETTTIPTTTTLPTGPPELCDGNNLRLVPNPDYCFRFYFCNFGVASPLECLPNTIFNKESQGCIAGNWDTCEPHTTTNEPVTSTEPETTTIPTTTTLPTGPPELCDGNNLRLVPNPDYCFRFYFCNFGVASPLECLPNTIFNRESQGCIAGNWDTCEPHTTTNEPVTSTEPETTTIPTTTTLPTGPPELCDGNNLRLVPNPDYCFRFYFCNFGVASPLECLPNTIFNKESQGCIAGNWDTCEPHTTTNEPVTSTEPESSTVSEISTEPETTTEPESSTVSEISTEPETTTEPESSTVSEISTEPETTTEPESSTVSEISTEPETTTEPESSTVSEISTEPETTTEPESSTVSEISTEPETTTEPESSTVSEISTEPETTTEPESSTVSEISTEPETTTEPESSTVSEISTEPETTTEPESSTVSEISTEPETTTEPESSTVSEISTEPETTTEPESSTVSEISTEPETTTEPESSTVSEISTEPETTTEPESSTLSEISTEPETTTEPESSTVSEISTEPETTTIPTIITPTPRPPSICDGNNFRFIPDPKNCFKFFYCIFGEALPGECAPNKIFSEQFRGCIDGDWDTCEPHTTTTQRPTPPPEICDGKDFLFVIDPNYCFRFYFCMFGVASPYECEPDKIFSQESQGCIDGYWDTCEPHTTTTTTQRPTPPPEICDGNDFLFVVDPNYCFRFYFCMFGVASPYECEPDTIFDEHYQKCIDGDWETCEPHTTTLSTTTTSTTQAPPNPCDGINLRFIPDPNYCFRFFYCMSGNALPGECTPNKIFDERFRGCIDGDWSTCEPHKFLL